MSEAESEAAQSKPARAFPSPLTILLAVLLLVWIAAFFIPSGAYQLDEAGSPIPGTFAQVEPPHDFAGRVRELLLAPVNGLYGIQDPQTGQIGPFNQGHLFGSAQVFLFILAIGGFMTVVFATGSLGLGIHHLAYRFRTSGPALIIILSVLFGLLGSVMSWSDETLGMYGLIIPLLIALRYDRMVAVAVVTVAPFVGRLGSTINPFVIGIGSDGANISLGDGLVWRVLLLILVMAATILYTLRYAALVRSDPARSLSGISAEDAALAEADAGQPPPMTGRDKAIIALVAFTFALLTFSIVPWGAIFGHYEVDPYTGMLATDKPPFVWELGWWLPELAALFFVMAIVVGIVGGLGEQGTSQAFIRGVVDFTGPAFLVVVARAISVVLTNTQTIDTILFSMEGLIEGTSAFVFTFLVFLVSLPLSFLIGGGSAGTALVMPVFAPLADFAGVDRSLVLTTWSMAGGWLLLILPTNAILVAGLAIAKVGYGEYLRFMMPLMGILLGICLVVMMLAVAVG